VQKENRTQRINQAKIRESLENIYISPLEKCNLACKLCYTHKHNNILSNAKILNFIKRYKKYINLKSIIFCGGEVFLLPKFTQLINKLLAQKIFITIITNGTIDKLNEINDPKNCQLLVSFDGPQPIHDQNRGPGNFQKSKKFVKHALDLGFPVEIMYLVTPQSYKYRRSTIYDLKTNFVTLKTTSFDKSLQNKPLTIKQIKTIKSKFNFGCFQLSLQSTGDITPCCEILTPLAKITDPVPQIIKNYKKLFDTCLKCQKCLGCPASNFLCGYIKELSVKNCQQVVKLLQ
jgi:sulfatase maturation enzyme AslB (radical SAM superfamily)